MRKKCPICHGLDTVEFLRVNAYPLVECTGCGLIRGDGSGGKTSYSGDDYFIAKYQYVERWDDFCVIFEDILEKVICFKHGGNLLDVGCGVGCLLKCAEGKGFNVIGVEVSDWASRFAREEKGLDVICATLEEAHFARDSFDVVIINHVLEHVDDPISVLKEVRKILKYDGLLVIGVPNIDSLMAWLAGEKWASLRPEEHNWHFTPKTLRHLLREAGFRNIWFESKDNNVVSGWSIRSLIVRCVNAIAVGINRSDAMLMFAVKERGNL